MRWSHGFIQNRDQGRAALYCCRGHGADVEDLTRRGFAGFLRFGDLAREEPLIPVTGGVYALVRNDTDGPEFLPMSPAGWWKGRDPTVPVERLAREWVEGAATVYIGKADDLRSRIDLLTGFTRGEPIMH